MAIGAIAFFLLVVPWAAGVFVEWTETLPEPLRWVLYLPSLVLAWMAAGLPLYFFLAFGSGWTPRLIASALSSGSLIFLGVELAPRGGAIVGWVLLAAVTGAAILAIATVIDLHAVGYLDIAQSIVWVVVAAITLQGRLEALRKEANSTS